MRWLRIIVFVLVPLMLRAGGTGSELFTTYPVEYPNALVNTLKGARPSNPDPENEYNTLRFDHVHWSVFESQESDTVEDVIEASNKRWAGYEDRGLRVIPHLNVQPWFEEIIPPNGLTVEDYVNTTPEFQRRLRLFIAKLGTAWDNDPRIAWINLGFFGEGGSHQNPWINDHQQEILKTAYNGAFKNKKFIMNFSDDFPDQEYGVYNRSWAHQIQLSQLEDIHQLNQRTGRWKVAPITGHVSYYHEDRAIHPGLEADDTLSTPRHLEFLLDTIRKHHCTALGSVCDYTNSTSFAGANEVQKALGYRFVVSKASWSRRVESGGEFQFSFTVKNTGSAPFYYDWPVYLYFLDPETRTVEARTELGATDIRSWLPGDDWDPNQNIYRTPALDYKEAITIRLPGNLQQKKYMLALVIADPLSEAPAVRFANKNYFDGCVHPLGYMGIGLDVNDGYEIDAACFNDPGDEGERKSGLAYLTEPGKGAAQQTRLRREK